MLLLYLEASYDIDEHLQVDMFAIIAKFAITPAMLYMKTCVMVLSVPDWHKRTYGPSRAVGENSMR